MVPPRTLAEAGELAVIGRIVDQLAPLPSPAGPGDDAALVQAPGGELLASTDALVEGVHFRLDWSTPEDVGAKAAAANLADMAAMGGTGLALLVSLVAPASTPLPVVEGFARGLAAEAAVVGATVVGGDVSAGSQLVLAVTALGTLAGATAVLRSGARPGDELVLAGWTGRSAAGLRLLRTGASGTPPALAAGLLAAHRRPRPPYRAGPELAAAGARAMCDVSDGLLADAAGLAAASGVAVEIDRLPLAAGVTALEALTGGEDHALLAAVTPGTVLPAGVRTVGRVLAGSGVRLTGGLAGLTPAGEAAAGGFAHFGAPAAAAPGQ